MDALGSTLACAGAGDNRLSHEADEAGDGTVKEQNKIMTVGGQGMSACFTTIEKFTSLTRNVYYIKKRRNSRNFVISNDITLMKL